jgi:hypothetical protein
MKKINIKKNILVKTNLLNKTRKKNKKIKIKKINKKINKPIIIYPEIRNLSKIDIVITFVDSTNLEWQKLFELHNNKKMNCKMANTINRFRNNDELKYCLRSIDKYIDFYNNIYIVMNHSPPIWLNINNPKLKIIDHKDIPGLNENLPTFSSMAIECNLHKINGLTDEFIYFNDDVFINKKIDKTLFKKEKINIYTTDKLTKKGKNNSKYSGHTNSWINANNLLDNNYKIDDRYSIKHIPHFINKKEMFYLEKKFNNKFLITTKNKFRNINNISPLCSILQYHYLYNGIGKIVKTSNLNKLISINDDYSNNLKKLKELDRLNPKIFCIEDDIYRNNQKNINLIKEYLEKKYPEKSQFEI